MTNLYLFAILHILAVSAKLSWSDKKGLTNTAIVAV